MKLAAFLMLLISVFGVTAITSAQTSDNKAEAISQYQALRSRVEQLITARKFSDFETLYKLTTSDYRKSHPLEDMDRFTFEPMMGLMSYYIEAIAVENDVGKVFMVEYAIPSALPSPRLFRNIELTWKKESGVWYLDPKFEKQNLTCGGIDMRDPSTMKKKFICGSGRDINSEQGSPQITPKACGR
ncbi:hypothetical protein JW823_09595 [bacterium]|nr:hypothetical protein [candidate division CSSED10-310 bacterium]